MAMLNNQRVSFSKWFVEGSTFRVNDQWVNLHMHLKALCSSQKDIMEPDDIPSGDLTVRHFEKSIMLF